MTTVIKQDISTNVLQIKVRKEEFLKAIGTVSGAISSKATLPILNNILIQSNGPDELTLIGTDLELAIKTKCPAHVLLQGGVTIPAKKLSEIIRELPSGEIEITVGKNNAVNIKTPKSFFKIMGLEPDDFPKTPETSGEQSCEMSAEVLSQCFGLTSFAISKDEARYTLNGVLMILAGPKARFVATDGKRLASIEKITHLPETTAFEAIIPAKTIFELQKALSSENTDKVRIVHTQNQIVFQLGETTFISRLIEGRFPNYEQVIPKNQKATTEINRLEFLSALKRVSLLTSQDNQSAKLDFIKGRVMISSRQANVGEAKEEIPAEISGDELAIGFNPTYLIDALKNLDTETVTISVTDPDKPGLIKTEGGYLYVVMPMQLG
jgi:DNA polymerase-3 subunit beta